MATVVTGTTNVIVTITLIAFPTVINLTGQQIRLWDECSMVNKACNPKTWVEILQLGRGQPK